MGEEGTAKVRQRSSVAWEAGGLLVGVLLYLVVEEFQLDTCLTEEFLALPSGVILALAHHALDAAVDDEHGAGAAGGHTAVEGGTIKGDAATGGLADGVLLGMDGTDAVGGGATVLFDGLAEEVSHLVAVRQPRGGTDIAGDEQLAVFDDDASATATVAGGTLGGSVGQLHEIFVPRGPTVHYLPQHLLYLLAQLLTGAVVVKTEVGMVNAVAEVLFVGVGVVHLSLLVGEEGVVVDMVGLAAAQYRPLVTHTGVGVDGKEVEAGLATQGLHLAGGADALDDAVAARGLRLLVKLLHNPRRRMLGTEVVAHEGHRVAVHLQPTTLNFLSDKSTNRIMHKATVLYQIVDDGAFACSQRAGDSDCYHN